MAMLLFFLIGATLYTGKYQRIENGFPQNQTFCQGILSEQPAEKAKSWALNLEQENGVHLLLYIGKDRKNPIADSIAFAKLNIGDTIFAHITHLNSTTQTTDATFLPYYRSLFSNGICATAYSPQHQWFVHPHDDTFHLLRSLRNLQGKMRQIYADNGINGESGSIIEAMTIGYKSNISKDLRTHYATSGVSHLLAMSGFHVGVIVILLQLLLFGKIIPFQWRWLCNLLIITFLWAFALIAGLSPSLVRATLMFCILLMCQSFSHELFSINSCALALLIMLIINPLSLHHIGFQLSFLSVVGICLFGTPLSRLISFRWAGFRFLWSIISISLICTLVTAPLVAYHFGYLPLLSIIANLVLTPLIYIVLWGGILWWIFLWSNPVNHFLTDVLIGSAKAMNHLTERIASLSFASVEWHPSLLTTLLCYTALLYIAYKTNKISKI